MTRGRSYRLCLLFVLAAAGAAAGCQKLPTAGPGAGGGHNTYLFCFWNVENFFDDQNDHRKGQGDKVYDPWFADNPDILKLKLSKLTEVLLKMNGGKGPDVIGLAEVESPRAAELLMAALNEKLGNAATAYKQVVMKQVAVGRHIAPAVISRLPVSRAKLHGRGMRVLETHVTVRDQDLVLLVSHWTSRVTDHADKGEKREKYGDQIYGLFKGMYKANPKVDFLVCGDFNDTPAEASVRDHLHAVGDPDAVLKAVDEPLLFNLMSAISEKGLGSHYDRGHWYLFDQIAVSRGLLDREGWSCNPQSAAVVTTPPRPGDHKSPHPPWKFGGPKDKAARGYSDHFPVTVELTVHAP